VSDTEPTANPGTDPAAASSEPAVRADAAAATTTSGAGITFDFTYGTDNYTVQVFAPDHNQQYGFTVTQVNSTTGANVTVASLIYANQDNWEISVGLPSALHVDTNLTVSKLTIDLTKGTVSALS
jgi:hypothetical protein